MKTYAMHTHPPRAVKVHTETKCDLCGKTTARNWGAKRFEVAETEVRLRTGENYPDGGSGQETTVDVCPTCFKEKLIPWVESLGGKPTVEQWDW